MTCPRRHSRFFREKARTGSNSQLGSLRRFPSHPPCQSSSMARRLVTGACLSVSSIRGCPLKSRTCACVLQQPALVCGREHERRLRPMERCGFHGGLPHTRQTAWPANRKPCLGCLRRALPRNRDADPLPKSAHKRGSSAATRRSWLPLSPKGQRLLLRAHDAGGLPENSGRHQNRRSRRHGRGTSHYPVQWEGDMTPQRREQILKELFDAAQR